MVSSAAYGMPGGLWHVQMLYGYKAPPKEERLAETALGHLVGTYRVNEQWARMQQGIAANTSQIVTSGIRTRLLLEERGIQHDHRNQYLRSPGHQLYASEAVVTATPKSWRCPGA